MATKKGTDRSEGGGGRLRWFGLIAGPAAAAVLLLSPETAGLPAAGQRTAAVAVWMALWWVTEAIPIPATALLPIVLFPLLGVMPSGEATSPYGHSLIFLFLGGFLIARAMQKWDLHRRIALVILANVSRSPGTLILGFMLATAAISMWISNTATSLMMMPIGLALITHMEQNGFGDGPGTVTSGFGRAMMLGIAYSASIGGIATLIGSPPNLVFAAALQKLYGIDVSFFQWMLIGLPLTIVFLPLAWLYLTRFVYRAPAEFRSGKAREIVRQELDALGPVKRGEKIVLAVFVLAALSWISLEEKEILGLVLPGLETLFPMIHDATVAVGAGLLLFMIPVDLRRRIFALDWEQAKKIPWGVLLLFGGGLSLAGGIQASGLAAWLGQELSRLAAVPWWVAVLVLIIGTAMMTELTSNTATSTMLMPVTAALAIGLGQNPVLFMIPAAMAASFAFMLPVATPPNAVVFGSGLLSIRDMFNYGIIMNLFGAALLFLAARFLLLPVFGVDLGVIPSWAL